MQWFKLFHILGSENASNQCEQNKCDESNILPSVDSNLLPTIEGSQLEAVDECQSEIISLAG